jgi:hypothetical protein
MRPEPQSCSLVRCLLLEAVSARRSTHQQASYSFSFSVLLHTQRRNSHLSLIDTFFADEGNRAALEQMLERGRADPGVLSRIVNGTPLMRVDIYRGADGPFVRVALLN